MYTRPFTLYLPYPDIVAVRFSTISTYSEHISFFMILTGTHCTECKHQIFIYFPFRLIVNITSYCFPPILSTYQVFDSPLSQIFFPFSSFSSVNAVIWAFPPHIVKIATHLTPLTQSKTSRTCSVFH